MINIYDIANITLVFNIIDICNVYI